MSDFKVGDVVWLLPGARSNTVTYNPENAKVSVPTKVFIYDEDTDGDWYVADEPLESTKPSTIRGYVSEEYLRPLEGEDKADNVNHPQHYIFSNGAEVIDITEQLSFNGGNAVKYVARATRQDGKVKGNVIEDLQKSLWYINRELERLS